MPDDNIITPSEMSHRRYNSWERRFAGAAGASTMLRSAYTIGMMLAVDRGHLDWSPAGWERWAAEQSKARQRQAAWFRQAKAAASAIEERGHTILVPSSGKSRAEIVREAKEFIRSSGGAPEPETKGPSVSEQIAEERAERRRERRRREELERRREAARVKARAELLEELKRELPPIPVSEAVLKQAAARMRELVETGRRAPENAAMRALLDVLFGREIGTQAGLQKFQREKSPGSPAFRAGRGTFVRARNRVLGMVDPDRARAVGIDLATGIDPDPPEPGDVRDVKVVVEPRPREEPTEPRPPPEIEEDPTLRRKHRTRPEPLPDIGDDAAPETDSPEPGSGPVQATTTGGGVGAALSQLFAAILRLFGGGGGAGR